MLFLISGCLQVIAQDTHFSQFFEAPLLRNPSLAGIYNGDIRVQGIYRDQWNSVSNAFRTGSLNAEYKMPIGKSDDFITTGVQFLFDKAGTVGLATTQVLLALNYHKSLSNEKPMYLSFGFMGGLISKTIDASKMTTDQQFVGAFNPDLANGETFAVPDYVTWDANAGMSFNTAVGQDPTNMIFVGIAIHHLNRPRNSFYKDVNIELHPKYVFSAGLRLRVDDFSSFILQSDQSVQGSFKETIAGALYSYNLGVDPENSIYTISAGGFLRWRDAVIPVIRLERSPIAVGISYDVNISQLKTVSQGRGGFEISVTYAGFFNRNNSSRNKVLCPRF
ncbi:MAG: PorP/SprF family type IX secretion system membrane protein [Flavitalea sp.]